MNGERINREHLTNRIYDRTSSIPFQINLRLENRVLLDATNPHIVATTLNEEIPLTVLSIFPFSAVKVSHPKFGTFKAWEKRTKLDTVVQHFRVHPHAQGTMSSSRGKKTAVPTSKNRNGALSFASPTTKIRHPLLQFTRGPQEELFQILQARPLIAGHCIDWATVEQVQLADAIRALLTTDPWELFFGIIEPTYFELTMKLCSMFHLQIIMTNYDHPDTSSVLHWAYIRRSSRRRINYMLSLATYISLPRSAGTLGAASYNPSHSKALVLPPSLKYLYTILAHTIKGRRESTGVINTHDIYFLWCMSHGHVIDLAYFIALAIQHQTKWHRKGVISIGPYVTLLGQHFGLLSTAAQESSLTLIGQMSPQGISSMISIKMIERCQGTYTPQYRLAQSTEEQAYEDILNDVPPQHEDLPT
ncbi:hypothetical protein GOBAR_AA26282 [Gossypium barbadense]|uniref:Uncharacterized protein n=1 Tax=Gossypium barbadense TaxID=3634 RepID=A0A2P5WTH8_GOSBA|nr:hypothetical protein GOBAR_AA26282 [Gossypium barbadense]